MKVIRQLMILQERCQGGSYGRAILEVSGVWAVVSYLLDFPQGRWRLAWHSLSEANALKGTLLSVPTDT